MDMLTSNTYYLHYVERY